MAIDGFCTVAADSLEDAIEIAAKIPSASMGGAVEIRQIASS